MDTFDIAGWWDKDAASRELEAWLNRALLAAFLAAWCLAFAALGRGAAREPGELCRKGLVCGLIAFLVHCALDFDYQVPGVAFTAWVVAALTVRPRPAAPARRLGPLPALALALGALAAMAGFQLLLWRATRAATEHDLAGSALRDAADPRRAPTRERSEALLDQACRHYEEAMRANPLDDALPAEYAALLTSRLRPIEPGPPSPEAPPLEAPPLRIRIATEDHVRLFARAVELYRRAAALNRAWAAPHLNLGRLLLAAAEPDAGPLAAQALAPLVPEYRARRAASGPNALYLPAVVELEQALARDPLNPKLMLPLAEALAGLGDLDAAAALAARALDIATRLYTTHPGHKLCLTADEAARLQRLIAPTRSPGSPPPP